MAESINLNVRKSTTSVSSHLILGCSSFAGIHSSITDAMVYETVKTAISNGFKQFDTAPHYGCGLGEINLGKALQSIDIDKYGIKIYSKVGRLMLKVEEGDLSKLKINDGIEIDFDNIPGSNKTIFPNSPLDIIPVYDYSSSGVITSLKESLTRLQVEEVYGLRLHDCESNVHIDAVLSSNGGLGALVKMRGEGVIKDVSVGVNRADSALKIVKSAPVGSLDSLMIAGCWNLLDHSAECMELLIECQTRGVLVNNAGVFASGLLAGGGTYKYAPASDVEINKTKLWNNLCVEYDVPLPAVALRFGLLHSAIGACAVGVKNPHEVLQIIEWFNCIIPIELFIVAKERGLLGSHIPL
mmetsp:Transcript_15179/g.14577  ORF Transcript_15179/g.14577 Transcript_15179/m.14577 type:complete len:355 (-) Transcript_15179:175-1239(-)